MRSNSGPAGPTTIQVRPQQGTACPGVVRQPLKRLLGRPMAGERGQAAMDGAVDLPP